MKRVLLHICCGPCASASIERLVKDGYEVALFFSNANIAPQSEYERRLAVAKKLAEALAIPLIVDNEPTHNDWLEKVATGLEECKEGEVRCKKCFAFNLERAFRYATSNGFDYFTTSLTISPHKNSSIIFAVGKEISPDFFLDVNFKKNNGFLRSIELAKLYGLYRQNYCGCEFSLRDAIQRGRDGK